nr:4-demethylwyosine synthase TYW1 [Candidatus Bathyarchaeota archaeon]
RGLNSGNMLSVKELMPFAEKIGELIGYKVIGSSIASRVVLLSKLDKPVKVA